MVKIIKILRVEDTRQWEEIEDDKWVPIPGTGIENNCGRCGRSHEVHARVQVEDEKDGTRFHLIVGTGCMHADEAEVAGKIRSILNAQRTLAKNRRLLAKKEALVVEYKRIVAEVDALPVPPCEIVRENPAKVGLEAAKLPSPWLWCGGIRGARLSENYLKSGHACHNQYMIERAECAVYTWKDTECLKRGLTHQMRMAWQYVADLKKRIERSEKKIAEFGLQEAVNVQ